MGSDIPKGAAGSPAADVFFRLDTKGDRQNLTYQSLHQASIPKYRTAGRGNVIGLDKGFRIIKDADSRRKVVASGLDSNVRQRQQSLLLAQPQSSQLIRSAADQYDTIINQTDYVAIESSRPQERRRLSASNKFEISDGSSSDESTHGMPLQVEVNDQDTSQDNVYQRQRALSEKTSKQPHDIEAWLALIDLQNDIVRATADKHVRLTPAQHRTASDLKISIYQEALSKISDPQARVRLTTGLMGEGSKFWDTGRQLAEWKVLIKQDPSFDLSILYLNFLQTNHANFSYQGCLEAYRECLETEMTAPARSERDARGLYLLLRCTMLMKQAGYKELATAIWQSMMEFNFYRPPSISADPLLGVLEEFWESEGARFGELGAKGWASMASQPPEPRADPAVPNLHNEDFYREWCLVEKNMGASADLPARALDNTSDEDPYRVVLFSDVKDFLFQLSSSQSQTLLVDALVCFSGLPQMSHSFPSSQWRKDPFLQQSAATEFETHIADELSYNMPFTSIVDDTTLFTSLKPFRALEPQRLSQPTSSWSCRGIEQLAFSRPEDENMGIYSLALALQRDPQHARKLAKRLIKQNPNSAALYNAYALVDAALGNQAAADNVWRTTIAMMSNSRTTDETDLLLLWRTWIFEVLRQGGLVKTKRLFESMATNVPTDNRLQKGTFLANEPLAKAEYNLQSGLSTALSSGADQGVILITDLLAMLRYCQNNQGLSPAIETYQNVLQILEHKHTGGDLHDIIETIHQRRSQLIYLHTSSNCGPFEPKQILRTLSDSAKAFPHNSIFITLHDQYQRKYGLMDRLRGIAAEAFSDERESHSPMRHIQSINREMSGSADFGTTEHSIRAAFHGATEEGATGCHCPTIRLGHVRWEVELLKKRPRRSPMSKQQERKQVSTAVQALHAALRACPWVKELYMLAFESEVMRDALGQAGLKQIYETMLERGLRVHIDISDRIEQQSES